MAPDRNQLARIPRDHVPEMGSCVRCSFASARAQQSKGLRLVRPRPMGLVGFAGTIGGRDAPGNGSHGLFKNPRMHLIHQVAGACPIGGIAAARSGRTEWIEGDATRGELPHILEN